MLDNAFAIEHRQDALVVFFDRKFANLIGFLQGERNFASFQQATDQFFGDKTPIRIELANDPKLAAQQQVDNQMMAQIKADPQIQFVLENLKGAIISCEPLQKKRE